MIHFPREALAQELVAALRGQTVFGDAHNGLFLAAPRRTGKSTFLQADLKPALEAAGAVVAYVDLWADPRRDPGSLIADAIARALAPRLGVVSRAAKAAGLESVTIAGALKIDVSKIGKIDGVTLPDALRALHEAAKAPVALIVDEAQHALTSEAGEATMSALKSARDQLNRHLVLILVHAPLDVVVVHQPAVEPDLDGVIAAHGKGRLPGRGGYDLPVEIGRANAPTQVVNLAILIAGNGQFPFLAAIGVGGLQVDGLLGLKGGVVGRFTVGSGVGAGHIPLVETGAGHGFVRRHRNPEASRAVLGKPALLAEAHF